MKWINGSTMSGSSLGQGATTYGGIHGTINAGATEANVQFNAEASYTWSGLTCYVITVSGTLTVRSRKNGANGAQVISATTTGFKEDVTNTDTIVANDLLNYSLVMSNSHTNSSTIMAVSSVLDDASDNSAPLFAPGPCTYLGSFFGQVTGNLGANSTAEVDSQLRAKRTGTIKNFRTRLSANTSTATNTIKIRKNGADGTSSVSYTAGETGVKEDTSGTDAIAVDDLVCFQRSAGNGLLTVAPVSALLEGGWTWNCSTFGENDPSRTGAVTWYGTPCGSSYFDTATEAQSQIPVRAITVLDHLQIQCSANGLNSASTFDLRVNAASPGGGPSLSIGTTTTGRFHDTTGTVTTAATDKINYRLVLGGTGAQTLEHDSWGCNQSAVPAAFTPPRPLVINQAVHRGAYY